jgi:glutamate racemase
MNKVYKVTLEEDSWFGSFYHELIVIACNTQQAINIARKEIGDKEEKSVLYDIQSYDKGVISKTSYY